MIKTSALCLASASPRRRELLAQIGLKPHILPCNIDESVLEDESPHAYVCRMATEKARAAEASLVETGQLVPVLAADTAVIAGQQILGKPADEQDALRMLTLLSACEHNVLSAVALIRETRIRVVVNNTRVQFRAIGRAEMKAYWRSGEPCDKAGAYAIQGLGSVFVRAIHGSYSGVVGLPLYETVELLREHGIEIPGLPITQIDGTGQ